MKKTILLFVTVFCLSFVSKATETVLFSGDQTTSLFSRMDIISWAVGETKENARYVNFGTDAEPRFSEIADNPVKTGLNKTDKAFHMYSLKGKSWWPDFLIMSLTEAITITEENRYLHVYHYRENLNKGFSLYLGDGTLPEDPDKGTKRFDLQLSKAGTWEDIVVDLKWFIDNGQPITAISFLIDRNWGGEDEPATHYYWDEIVLNNSKLPRGLNIFAEKEINLFPGNTASYSKWVESTDLQHGENISTVVANPFTTQTAVLNSSSIVKFDKSANASWWQGGPRYVLKGSMKVGTEGASYLHVMVNIPEIKDSKEYYVVQLNARNFSGKEIDSGTSNKYWADDKGKWIDCVMDVTSLEYVSEVVVRFDVRKDDADKYINSPAGTFYLDAIAINGQEAPREKVTGNSNLKVQNGVKAFAANQRIVVDGNVTSIEVYTLAGKKIAQYSAISARTEIPVAQNGVYLVKTISNDKSVFCSKVIIR